MRFPRYLIHTPLDRFTTDPEGFNGKPIIRGHRLAVEHVLGLLTVGDDMPPLNGYAWMEREKE